MRVVTLDLDGFRNLAQTRLECAPGLNLLTGPNASGKTSVLEALYLLGRGRSFRARQPRELIQTGAPALQIAAIVSDAEGRRTPLGLARDARQLTLRLGGAPVRSLAELARCLPVLLLNPDSHRLLEDGPRQRRRFMDWGLFHAEPGFLEVWRRYDTALRHRNAALRAQAADRVVDAWDGELASAAARLDPWRETFCNALGGVLRPLAVATLGEGWVEVDYRRGWPLEPFAHDFAAWLRAGRAQDRQQGHTRLGPHRADFIPRLAGRPLAEVLSRGQQKLLVIALVLAQAELYRRQAGDACILLIDDLPAELDPLNRTRVVQALAALDSQLFVTAIEPAALALDSWPEARIFQLCQGRISRR